MMNKLSDLNNILFEQLERINDDELSGDALEEQLKKSKMVAAFSSNIIKCGQLQLDAIELAYEAGASITVPPLLLGE
jgi:hypothetical protein